MIRTKSYIPLIVITAFTWQPAIGQRVSILEAPITTSEASADDPAIAAETEELPLPRPEESLAEAKQSTDARPPVFAGSQDIGSSFALGAPLHEAFATAAQSMVRAGSIVSQAPPPDLTEQPSAPVKSGTNSLWINGYWTWHEGAYVWITGMHREIPPGRRWVPGRWSKTAGGYQRYSGFWAEAGADNVFEVPRPPEHIELPPIASPSADVFWVPAKHTWRDARFELTKGFWTKHQPKFIWQPATYVQTPGGFVFVSGYWDFEIATRGIPLAPVRFGSPPEVSSTFTPSVALASEPTLLVHLFFRRNDHQLYFSDFARSANPEVGLVPWYHSTAEAISSLPLHSYYSWKFSHLGKSLDTEGGLLSNFYNTDASVDIQPRLHFAGSQQFAFWNPQLSGFQTFSDFVLRTTSVPSQPYAQNSVQHPLPVQSPTFASGISQQSPSIPPHSSRATPRQHSSSLAPRVTPRVAVPPIGLSPRSAISLSAPGPKLPPVSPRILRPTPFGVGAIPFPIVPSGPSRMRPLAPPGLVPPGGIGGIRPPIPSPIRRRLGR